MLNNYIFVPIGSYEQHGPHLPPATDYLIAKRIVQQVSLVFNGKNVEGIKIGISPEHEGFDDTKSISPKEFKTQIVDIISRFPEISRFFLINSHGGNNKFLNSIQELYKHKVLVLNTFSLIKTDLKAIRTSELGGICHAGEFETSIMLYLYPEKVNIKNLKKNDIKYVPFLDPNCKNKKATDWKTINLSKSGVLGDPSHATPEKGEKWFIILIEKIKAEIWDFISKMSK